MLTDVRSTALMRFLAAHHSHYHSKALELKISVTDWLNYIPATFPHYTRHTVGHSEEIIAQMSKILFKESNIDAPVLPELSGVEAYILVAAAYLHDAGMTVSDGEKASILQSADWKAWVDDGSGAERFREVTAFREGHEGGMDATTRSFLADVQLRFLIAEFVRRTHHIRGGDILALHQDKMGRFGYDDPILIRTIQAVCVAHGLQQHELNDPVRFPERRDVQNEQVNVRMLAILLRLGDLLDMSYDRACPLLLNAASPIPADSMAHWSQYKRITHRSVEHDKIEITAECEKEEEHRFLHDWCDWLVSELDKARRLMARSARHAGWIPPIATIDQPSNNTITITPAPGARYIPARWRFELDTKAIFDRLIYDALDSPWDFLRELLQNAADATRCRMFAELRERDGQIPEYPTQVNEHVRNTYPIRVTLTTTAVRNELSGKEEQRQVLVVEDMGLGMDQYIIQKYLLQVGRSFYTTREFREKFGFVASSRFGIGFLSVFGVSDDVTIETFKPSIPGAESLKLRLTGPRSYLLTEKGNRNTPGTKISVVLRDNVSAEFLTEKVAYWCKKLEFPVIVSDLGNKVEVQAEKPEDFVKDADDLSEDGAKMIIRSFSVNGEGLTGEMYLFVHVSSKGEDWTRYNEIKYNYSKKFPHAIIPDLPSDLLAFHGIKTGEADLRYLKYESDEFSIRLDLRAERFSPSLARTKIKMNDLPEIENHWDIYLRQHIDSSTIANDVDGWVYKQDLSKHFGSWDFWVKELKTIALVGHNKVLRVNGNDIIGRDIIKIIVPRSGQRRGYVMSNFPGDEFYIPDIWLRYMSDRFIKILFNDRMLIDVEILEKEIICSWKKEVGVGIIDTYKGLLYIDVDPKIVGGRLHRVGGRYSSSVVAINRNSVFGKWFMSIEEVCDKNEVVRRDMFERLKENLKSAIRGVEISFELKNLNDYLAAWRQIPGLPDELIPPVIPLSGNSFSLGHEDYRFYDVQIG